MDEKKWGSMFKRINNHQVHRKYQWLKSRLPHLCKVAPIIEKKRVTWAIHACTGTLWKCLFQHNIQKQELVQNVAILDIQQLKKKLKCWRSLLAKSKCCLDLKVPKCIVLLYPISGWNHIKSKHQKGRYNNDQSFSKRSKCHLAIDLSILNLIQVIVMLNMAVKLCLNTSIHESTITILKRFLKITTFEFDLKTSIKQRKTYLSHYHTQ